MSDSYRPVKAVKVREQNGELVVSIPVSVRESLGLEQGDGIVPLIQDGLLVYVPLTGISDPGRYIETENDDE